MPSDDTKPDGAGARFSLAMRVRAARHLAAGILSLELVDEADRELPSWTPGAHIDLVLPSGATRSYSLCGDTNDARSYQIAILDDPNGRGASREIHTSDLVGRLLRVSPPRNEFELLDAPHVVFIAGGIGITPILPMAQMVEARQGSWEMHYLGRSRPSMAFLDPLAKLAASSGRRLDVIARDERERIVVSEVVADLPPGSAVYCCGPERLMRDVEQACAKKLGLDLHVERFGRSLMLDPEPSPASAKEPDDAELFAPCDPEGSFTVELRKTGQVLEVQEGQSVLECVRKVRSGLSFSCSDGYCGTCETAVIAGKPDHRDTVLSEEERAENRTMMICVGRSRTRRLVLDL